jgi:hypothetical protein
MTPCNKEHPEIKFTFTDGDIYISIQVALMRNTICLSPCVLYFNINNITEPKTVQEHLPTESFVIHANL